MITRRTIQLKIRINEFKIKELQIANEKLIKDDYLYSDKAQWFIEKPESVGKKNKEVDALVGRVYWNENFIDGDTRKLIPVERSKIVRINGEWVI